MWDAQSHHRNTGHWQLFFTEILPDSRVTAEVKPETKTHTHAHTHT